MTESTYDRTGAARLALMEIYRDYGPAGLDNDVVMNQLLPDQLPNAPRESSAIRAAASVGVAGLLNARYLAHVPVEAAIRDVAGVMMERHALDQFACLWIVSEYSIALGHPPAAPILPQFHGVSAPPSATNVDAPPYGGPPPVMVGGPGMGGGPSMGGGPGMAGGPGTGAPIGVAVPVVRAPVDGSVPAGPAPNPGFGRSTVTALIVALAVVTLLLAVDVVTGWPPALTGGHPRTVTSPVVVVSTLVATETATVTTTVTVGATLSAAEQGLVSKISDADFTDCRSAPRPTVHVVAAVYCSAVNAVPSTDPLIMLFDTRPAMDAYMVPSYSTGAGNCQTYNRIATYWFSNANKAVHLGDLDCNLESGSYKLVWSYYASDIVIVALGRSGAPLYTWWTNVSTTATI